VGRRVAGKPGAEVVCTREGAAAARAVLLSPSPGSLWPLDVLQMDHTPVDLILVDEAARRPIGRPWLTLAMDVDSRMVACVATPISYPDKYPIPTSHYKRFQQLRRALNGCQKSVRVSKGQGRGPSSRGRASRLAQWVSIFLPRFSRPL
jgi:hypothetical protein